MDTRNLAPGSQNLSPSASCPNCAEISISYRTEVETFQYGHGDDTPTLSAHVSVYTCRSCGEDFLDHTADEARHTAVCRHLGVLTPDEIANIRTRYGLSRAEFSKITRLGEATLARWERGSLIQNLANDRYLRLLSEVDNLARLRELEDLPSLVGGAVAERSHPKFRSISESPRLRQEAQSFKLNPRTAV